MDVRERIVKRVARELKDGDYVNLGIGLPTLVANYVPADIDITLHAENGRNAAAGMLVPFGMAQRVAPSLATTS